MLSGSVTLDGLDTVRLLKTAPVWCDETGQVNAILDVNGTHIDTSIAPATVALLYATEHTSTRDGSPSYANGSLFTLSLRLVGQGRIIGHLTHKTGQRLNRLEYLVTRMIDPR